MIPPENAWPPPDTLTCQLKLGSLPLPFDWYGPATFRLTGCESCATPFTLAWTLRVMSALEIGVLNALSMVARASSLLPPPPPPQPATSASARIDTTSNSLFMRTSSTCKGGNVGARVLVVLKGL